MSLATCIYVCLSGLWLGGLLYLSFLSYFFKLVCYIHVFPYITMCIVRRVFTLYVCVYQVTVIGDGRGEIVTVAGDKLYDSDSLVKSGSTAPLPLPIKDTSTSLSSKVFA